MYHLGVVHGTFFDYAPYNFNRHLSNFKNKNYQFWHQLYSTNIEHQPFLRYSQPSYVSGSINSNINPGWTSINDVYNLKYPYNMEVAPSTLLPAVPKRTTRPRVTYTTKARTTVSLGTEPWQSTSGLGLESETQSTTPATTASTDRTTKSPSDLQQQIANINAGVQSLSGLLNRPTKKPEETQSTTGNALDRSTDTTASVSRPSRPPLLLQQIQKLNSTAQNLLGNLGPKPYRSNSADEEERIEIGGMWTTARTTPIQTYVESEPIRVQVNYNDKEKDQKEKDQQLESTFEQVQLLKTKDDLVIDALKLESDSETTTIITRKSDEISKEDESMILISTSEDDLNLESRHQDMNLPETTTLLDYEMTTGHLKDLADTSQEDLDDLEMNRQEEYELDSTDTNDSDEDKSAMTTTELPTTVPQKRHEWVPINDANQRINFIENIKNEVDNSVIDLRIEENVTEMEDQTNVRTDSSSQDVKSATELDHTDYEEADVELRTEENATEMENRDDSSTDSSLKNIEDATKTENDESKMTESDLKTVTEMIDSTKKLAEHILKKDEEIQKDENNSIKNYSVDHESSADDEDDISDEADFDLRNLERTTKIMDHEENVSDDHSSIEEIESANQSVQLKSEIVSDRLDIAPSTESSLTEFVTNTEKLTTEAQTNAPETDTTTDDDDHVDTTTVAISTTSEESGSGSSINNEIIQFILIDILQAANTLQTVMDLLIDPFSLDLNKDFAILQSLVISAREKGASAEDANRIDYQIVKITSNITLQRLRSNEIFEKKRRLSTLGKLLKVSIINID